jgi:hypothetical protein
MRAKRAARIPDSRTVAWTARVGARAALQLRSHRLMLRVGWIALLVGVPILAVGAAFLSMPDVDEASGIGIAVVATVGLVGVITWGSTQWTARRFTWVQIVGEAAQALQPRLAANRARELGRALRSVAVFDEWSSRTGTRLATETRAPEAWASETVRPILGGPTARRLFRCVAIGWFGMCGAVVLAGAVGAGDPYGPSHSPVPYFIPLEVAATFFVVSAVLFLLKDSAEYTAGYTTRFAVARGISREIRTAVELVDFKTGYLLRAAGDPGLTTDEYWHRVTILRADHPTRRPPVQSVER